MAVDKTEVPTGTVIGIGVIVLATLVAVQYSVTSYFHSMYGDEQQRKVLGVESGRLREARARETLQLARINDGIQQVAGSLGNGVRPAAITPRPSADMQALQGWGQRPRVVPNPPPARGELPAGADTTPPRAANAPSAQPVAPVPSATVAPIPPAGAAPAAAAH